MSCFQVAVLASGSKGNATVMRCEAGMVLVDAGISCRRIVQGMQKLGLRPENLDGVFITHEHIDHVKGLETFTKKYPVPIYASAGTWRGIKQTLPRIDLQLCNRHIFAPQTELTLGGLQVRSFSTSHDALDPTGYSFRYKNHTFSYVTDTGYVSDIVKRELDGAEVLVIETNHDPILLKNGSYPPVLQKRILGTRGHLANETAGRLLTTMKALPRQVFLAHLSQENNTPDLALSTVQGIVTQQCPNAMIQFYVTSQDEVVKNREWEDYHEQNIFE
jgi:phosphoribosyl 1,2-cyclic phosphodiesterase